MIILGNATTSELVKEPNVKKLIFRRALKFKKQMFINYVNENESCEADTILF